MRHWWWIPLILSLGCDCGGPSKAPEAEGSEAVEVGGYVYKARDGVILDIPKILGRELATLDNTALGEQLGLLEEETQLPGVRGLERIYEMAVLRITKGRIYYISHTFDVPVDRTQALQTMGLPGSMSALMPRSLQFRVDRPSTGIRRIALQRAEMRSEMITRVEVWSLLPTELN